MELIVSKLVQATSFLPVAVALHCEQILCDIASLDALRFVALVMPYLAIDSDHANLVALNDNKNAHTQVRLTALHSAAIAVKNLSSAKLLCLLGPLVEVLLPHFSSSVVDIRKAVVFVLVEIYLIVGDALQPLVSNLSISQRKLLTVYIERQIQKKPSFKSNGGFPISL